MTATICDLYCSETYVSLDPSGLRHRLRDMPRQCREAWHSCKDLQLPEHWQDIDKVVIGGMGGSAIAGDLVSDLAAFQQGLPFLLVRNFSLPFRLDSKSLFIACSHSGATEETISLFRQALDHGACTMAITGGSTLAEEARASGRPLLSINAPGEPRSAVGCSLMLLLGALNKAGVMVTREDEVEGAVLAMERQIARCSEEVPSRDNPAKQLAQDLRNKLIVIYGGSLFSALGRRWKTQLNENAKTWAFSEDIPELLHNSVEAFPSSLVADRNILVMVLQPNAAGHELNARYWVITQLLDREREKFEHRIIKAEERSPLAQVLSMLALGDYVSYYLALLQGLDPSPTPSIQLGKELLNDAVGGALDQAH